MNYKKYKKMYFPIALSERKWPGRVLENAPDWCSVDLRDGNQALITPMGLQEKLDYFSMLVDIGFKEIEVSFPAASDSEFLFVRKLIEENLVPDDVTIQVLTQSREHIIKKTFEAISGAKNAVVHLYNSTSELQRRVVFGMDKKEIVRLAVEGAALINDLAAKEKGNIVFEYSPESFMGTEMEFAAEICNEVLAVWTPTRERKAIINLPTTVEVSSPNIFADQVEYMCGAIKGRENVRISIHAHNDRGCAIATSELGILAGADRVEGTLFGNGERTGNADLLVMALNMYSQGINPGLDLSNLETIITRYENSTHMDVSPRHPYAGDLVYTAFSGSHQDAIKKSMDYHKKSGGEYWENPYIPIDPSDIGRHFEPIRINSQSGKGGISYVLARKFGVFLPKAMAGELSAMITGLSDAGKRELTPQFVYDTFIDNFLDITAPLRFVDYDILSKKGGTEMVATIDYKDAEKKYVGTGNGPLDALMEIVRTGLGINLEVAGYHEHALTHGSSSEALAYVAVRDADREVLWGAGSDTNINTASIKALISAVNRYLIAKN